MAIMKAEMLTKLPQAAVATTCPTSKVEPRNEFSKTISVSTCLYYKNPASAAQHG